MAANVTSAPQAFALDLKLLGSLASNSQQLRMGQAGNLHLIQFVVGTTKQQQLILQPSQQLQQPALQQQQTLPQQDQQQLQQQRQEPIAEQPQPLQPPLHQPQPPTPQPQPEPPASEGSRKRKRQSKSPSPRELTPVKEEALSTGPSTCTICNKTFDDKLEFNSHIKVHLRQKINARRELRKEEGEQQELHDEHGWRKIITLEMSHE